MLNKKCCLLGSSFLFMMTIKKPLMKSSILLMQFLKQILASVALQRPDTDTGISTLT